MFYRSDIDGLRAIAVLLVLFFHAGFTLFPSGFIGVDIFFVISGFLIASIIKNKLETKSFSFTDFYLRRIWRLQPAMLAMLVFSFIIASLLYLPEDYSAFLKSLQKSLFFVSNRYFSDVTSAYAAPDSNAMLLLHTWSLAVEWQWYLFFPAIYYFLSKKLNHKKQLILCLVLILLTFGVTWHYIYNQPTKTYYFFASRIFEFLIGMSACFIIPHAHKASKISLSFLSAIAFVTIVIIALTKNITPGYPNGYTLLVCLSTAAIIIAGSKESNPINRVLSFGPLVWTGKLSYSLYLFHWPIFAALHYVGITSLTARLAGLCLALILAIGCYYFIEKPYRTPRFTLKKSLALLVLLPLLLVISFTPLSKRYDTFSHFRFGNDLSHINDVLKSTKLEQRQDCMNENVSGTDMACVVGDKSSDQKALLMGDSHSNQYWNFFDVMGKNAHIAVDMKATSLCLAIPNIYHADMYTYKGDFYKMCRENVEHYYAAIEQHKYKFVIISEVWQNYPSFNVRNNLQDQLSPAESIEVISASLDGAIQTIIQSGAKPVLIKTMFGMPENYLTCFYEHFKTRKAYSPGSCNPAPSPVTNNWTDQLFAALQRKYPELIVIDPKDAQCQNGKCNTEIEGIPLYRDVGHLNDYASEKLGEIYLKRYGNPLRQ